MKSILISAYSVNPYEGSEGGTGWNIVAELSKHNKLLVITRNNNLPEINKYFDEVGRASFPNLEFVGYDLPNWAMKWKKRLGERGYVLYFYFWQLFLPLFIRKNRFEFDIAHSLNFHSDSHPTFLWVFGKPTYWGPIGHHPKVPRSFVLHTYGIKNYTKDRLYFAIKWSMRNLDPLYHLSKRMIKKVFVINSSIPKAIGVHEKHTTILPAVATETPTDQKDTKEGFTILSVGRFHYMKGFDIAIQAFDQFAAIMNEQEKMNIQLLLVGKGPEKDKLSELIKRSKIAHRIEIINWIEKKDMEQLYRKSSVFLFPSHEGAGMVIPEAMSYGIPTLTFDNVGPGELAGPGALKVPYSTYGLAISSFANHLKHLYYNEDLYKKYALASKRRFEDHFTWSAKAAAIQSAYEA